MACAGPPTSFVNNVAVRFIDREGDKLTLTDEGIQLLESIEGNFGVVAIIGPYRLGKSYLMSRIAGQQNIFPLGHKMQACTKGAWAYLMRASNGKQLLLLDLEGLDDVDEEEHAVDTKLWILSLLLPTLLIYNIARVIDKHSTESLEVMVSIAKNMKILNEEGGDMSSASWKVSPHLVMCLRDVLLERPENPQKYVRDCLSKLKGSHGKEVLKWFGNNVDLLMITVPSTDRKVMQQLESIPFSSLDSNFQQEMNEATASILNWVEDKQLHNLSSNSLTKMNGKQYLIFVQTIVAALNSNEGIVLDSLFSSISDKACREGIDDGVEEYKQFMFEHEKDMPLEIKELQMLHDKGVAQAKAAFEKKAMGPNQHMEWLKLKTVIERTNPDNCELDPTCLLAHFHAMNDEASKNLCEQLMQGVVGKMEKDLLGFKDLNEFAMASQKLEEEYQGKAKGPAAAPVLMRYSKETKKVLMEKLMSHLQVTEAQRQLEREKQDRLNAEKENADLKKKTDEINERMAKMEQRHRDEMKTMEAKHEESMENFRKDQQAREKRLQADADLLAQQLRTMASLQQSQSFSMPSFSSSGYGVSSPVRNYSSNGPRCKDGSLDMRFSVNRGRSKYGD